jgi:hypothetical protein
MTEEEFNKIHVKKISELSLPYIAGMSCNAPEIESMRSAILNSIVRFVSIIITSCLKQYKLNMEETFEILTNLTSKVLILMIGQNEAKAVIDIYCDALKDITSRLAKQFEEKIK